MLPSAIAFLNTQRTEGFRAHEFQAQTAPRLAEIVEHRNRRFARNGQLPAQFSDVRKAGRSYQCRADLDPAVCVVRESGIGEIIRTHTVQQFP